MDRIKKLSIVGSGSVEEPKAVNPAVANIKNWLMAAVLAVGVSGCCTYEKSNSGWQCEDTPAGRKCKLEREDIAKWPEKNK